MKQQLSCHLELKKGRPDTKDTSGNWRKTPWSMIFFYILIWEGNVSQVSNSVQGMDHCVTITHDRPHCIGSHPLQTWGPPTSVIWWPSLETETCSLDLTVQGSHPLQTWDMGTLLLVTSGGYHWRLDETCSLDLTVQRPSPANTDIWWPLKHVGLASRRQTSYWNAFLFSQEMGQDNPCSEQYVIRSEKSQRTFLF